MSINSSTPSTTHFVGDISINNYVTVTENPFYKQLPLIRWRTNNVDALPIIKSPICTWFGDYASIIFEITKETNGYSKYIIDIRGLIRQGCKYLGSADSDRICLRCKIDGEWCFIGKGNEHRRFMVCENCYKTAKKSIKCNNPNEFTISYKTKIVEDWSLMRENMLDKLEIKKKGYDVRCIGKVLINAHHYTLRLGSIRSNNHKDCIICNGDSDICFGLAKQIFTRINGPKYLVLKYTELSKDIACYIFSLFTLV